MEKAALSPYNKYRDISDIIIYDSTMRDGEQMPRVSFTRDEKIALAMELDMVGVRQIEAGFPAVSDTEKETVRDIARMGLEADILALSRTCRKDIDRAVESEADMVMLFTATSDMHLRYKYMMTRDEQLEKVIDAFDYAKENGLTFSFSTEDSTRTSRGYLDRIFGLAIDAGACRIGIADTTGCILPGPLGQLVRGLTDKFQIPLSVHLHNDFGLGLANALSSIENGATAVATTVNGIGERAGNVPTEQLAVALEVLYSVDTGIRLEMLPALCKKVSGYSGVPMPQNQPWFGENAFRHESGIHVAAILSNPLTYECVDPGLLGREREIILGKHSGRVAVMNRLGDLDIGLGVDEFEAVFTRVKEEAQEGNIIDDIMLQEIIESVKNGNN